MHHNGASLGHPHFTLNGPELEQDRSVRDTHVRPGGEVVLGHLASLALRINV